MSQEMVPAHELVQRPAPLGLVRASETALFIASPLLSAGSLSLIGVVCADANEFKFAGPALLLLVSAVIALLLSIQLGYHARQWIYSYEEICNWTARKCPTNRSLETQSKDFRKGKEKLDRAGLAYNAGTVFLSFAVAAALIPDRPGDLTVWRWIAAAFVTAAAIGESIWAIKIYAGTIGQFDHPTKSHSTPPSEGGNPHV